MTIHHATIKSAASKGVILTCETGVWVKAHRPEPNRSITFDVEPDETNSTETAKDAWVALDEILAYEAEHPQFRIEYDEGDYVGYDAKSHEEIARDPDLQDLYQSLEEAAEGAEEGEGEPLGSVVPEKYKKEYAERGDASHCGDWLALTINSLCRVMDGNKEVTDLDRLQTIAAANDVDPARYGKLGVETNGWQGRYRMTVRNMLTPRVAAKGFLFVPDGADDQGERELQAPREWCAAHSPKAKPEKSAKAAVSKDEGAGKKSAKSKAMEQGVAAATAAVKASKAKGR